MTDFRSGQPSPDTAHPFATGIVGATGQIYPFLLPRLLTAGHRITVLSRRKGCDDSVVDRVVAAGGAQLGEAIVDRSLEVLFWLAPLTALPPVLSTLSPGPLRRLVAFGTTSRHYKGASRSRADRDLASSMARAEEEVLGAAGRLGVAATLFRPTMIYGGSSGGVAMIEAIVRRLGVFPLVGGGTGLRQPVHADDLAGACLAVLDRAVTYGRVYDLAGGEVLSYREMVVQVFESIGRRPRFMNLPAGVLRAAVAVARLVPSLRQLSPDLADRMAHDLCFDNGPAASDFGYAPRGFRPAPPAPARRSVLR